MTRQIALRLPAKDLAALDAAVARGTYPNRTALVRAALHRLLREERDRAIAEEYRRGYGSHPQEAWLGDLGLALLGAAAAAEEHGRPPV